MSLPDRDEADYAPEEGEAMRMTVCPECRRIDCVDCDLELLADALTTEPVALQGTRQTGRD